MTNLYIHCTQSNRRCKHHSSRPPFSSYRLLARKKVKGSYRFLRLMYTGVIVAKICIEFQEIKTNSAKDVSSEW